MHHYRNKITKEEVALTDKELARFFDNRNPFEWVHLYSVDSDPIMKE